MPFPEPSNLRLRRIAFLRNAAELGTRASRVATRRRDRRPGATPTRAGCPVNGHFRARSPARGCVSSRSVCRADDDSPRAPVVTCAAAADRGTDFAARPARNRRASSRRGWRIQTWLARWGREVPRSRRSRRTPRAFRVERAAGRERTDVQLINCDRRTGGHFQAASVQRNASGRQTADGAYTPSGCQSDAGTDRTSPLSSWNA